MTESRTLRAKKNIIWSLVNKMAVLVLSFATRTVFIYALGSEYLGLNGLFSSVLNILSLTELGVGAAMVYSLYAPMADRDTNEICALLGLYRKLYRLIGLVILTFGLLTTPFLSHLIKGELPQDINIYIVYAVFLGNTALSYFLYSYKQSLFIADQHMDITNNISTVLSIMTNVVQIIALLLFHNYYAYIILFTVHVIANNLIVKLESDRRYPDYVCRGHLSADTLAKIKKRVGGLFIYRVCNVFRDSVDNIFISAYISLATLGVYSNCVLLMTTVQSFFNALRQSVTATIGNSIVKESEEKNHKDFFTVQWLYQWAAIWAATCLYCLMKPFVIVWLGESFLIPQRTVFLISTTFVCYTLGDICATYRHAIGLWWQDRLRPVTEVAVKLGLSFILVKTLGIDGLLLSTIICLLFVNSIWASYILYRHYFVNHKQMSYILRNIVYLAVALLTMRLTGRVCGFVDFNPVLNLLISMGICIIIPNLVIFCFFRMMPEYDDGKALFFRLIRK